MADYEYDIDEVPEGLEAGKYKGNLVAEGGRLFMEVKGGDDILYRIDVSEWKHSDGLKQENVSVEVKGDD